MSRILKRPMFRDGGRANSKGTGIMTGVEDREEYQTGGDVKTIFDYMSDPRFQDTYKAPFVKPGSPVGQMATRPQRMEMLGFLGEAIPSSDIKIPLGEEAVEAQRAEPFLTKRDIVTAKGPTITEKDTDEDDDLDKITPDDLETYEEKIMREAEAFEKILSGPDARKRSIFKALTAAAPEILEEEYGKAIKAAGEELDTPEEIATKARLLAIQKNIEEGKDKTPTKSQEVEILAQRYIANGMNKKKAYESAEKKVYGTGESPYTAPLTEGKQLQILEQEFIGLAKDNDLIAENPAGFAKAQMLQGTGIQIIDYDLMYNEDKNINEPIPTIKPKDMKIGTVYFDPIGYVYYIKDETGQVNTTYDDAKALALVGKK